MSATIARISWVIILVVIWKVLMNRLSPEVSYFRIRFKLPSRFKNTRGYTAMAKRYRTFAARESDSNKKNEYLKKAEEMEHKAKQQTELKRERDANNIINAANNAREEPSLDWRGRTTSPQQRVNDAVKNAMKAFRRARKF